jgi:SAF domain
MATTLPKRTPASADRTGPSLVPGGGRQRRWSLALLAVLVTLGSALAFVVLWMNAGDRKPVLAMKNDVAAGQIIEADDLKVVRVSADSGVALVASSASDDVVGQPATTNLLAGSLLVADAVGSDDGLAQGTTVIAIPVPRTEIPSDDLETGDRLVLYRTPGGSGDAGTGTDVIGSGRVFSVDEGDDGSTSDIRVSVTVDEGLAPEIASAVAQDQIYLAKAATG